MLAATPTLAIGAATIFTERPPLPFPPAPNQATPPFLTPSDQPVVTNNLVGPSSVGVVQTSPAIAPGSPAAAQPVETNRGWSLMLTRNPSQSEYLTNKDAFTTDGTKLIPYSGPYPDAPFFGPKIDPVTFKAVGSPGIVASYAPNTGNPNTLGPLSFRTNLLINPSSDGTTGFGAPNKPFASNPTELFAIQSTAQYLDYRPNLGNPNGSETVVDQDGKPVGLLPYYTYDLPGSSTTSTNSFFIPNSPDLSVSLMDLSQKNSDGSFQAPTGIDANNLQVLDSSDYAATLGWGSDTTGRLQVTMASGSPFAQFTYDPGPSAGSTQRTLVIRNADITGFTTQPIQNTATVYQDLNAVEITGYGQPNTTGMKVITDPAADPASNPNLKVKTFYAAYFPAGTSLSTMRSLLDGMTYDPNSTPLPQVPLFGQGANNLLIDVPSLAGSPDGKFHFVIAALPDDSKTTVALFRDYAFNYITGGRGDFTYDPTTNQVGLTLSETTRNVDAQSTAPGALLVVYPHQYKFLDAATYGPLYTTDPNAPGSLLTMPSVFGTTRFLPAPTVANPDGTHTSTISYSLPYQGSLSILSQGAFKSTDPNDQPTATQAEINQTIGLIRDRLNNVNPTDFFKNNGLGITYVWGQDLNTIATLVPIADQLGLKVERDTMLNLLKSEFTQWFTASKTLNDNPNQFLGYTPKDGIDQFLCYDKMWNALIGYAAGFGTDTALADLHYTWGYWIKAASIVATYDPTFLDGFGPMVTTLIKNVANPDRSDTMFPYLRVFNPYDGHSWAAGVYPVGDANNEESTSEAITFYSAMIDWGNLLIARARNQNNSDPVYKTGQSIRNTGIALQTFEIEALRQYWLNVDGDTFPKLTFVTYGGHTYAAGGYIQRYSYAGLDGKTDVNPPSQWKDEIYASNQFLLKRGTQTFFVGADPNASNNAEGHYAITILPFGPSSLYLGRDVSYKTQPTNGDAPRVRNILQENYNRYIADQNVVYGNPVPGQLRNIPNLYTGDILDYQALFDPQAALGRWNGIGNYRLNYPATATPDQLASDDFSHYTFNITAESKPATYYFMQFFNKYGQVSGDVYALDATQTAVLDRPRLGSGPYVRTYIVENVMTTAVAAVHFSDGYTVTNVPRRTVYAVTVTRNNPNGPAVQTVINTYTIPDLSGAPAGPPDAGTNFYLGYTPNPSPPSPTLGTVQPLTATPQASPGVVPLGALQPDGTDAKNYFYPYTTPYVRDFSQPTSPYGFRGDVQPTNLPVISYQIKNVNGTYDPTLDTHFQLVFKAPLGQTSPIAGASLQIAVQVRYDLNDAAGTSYVETYPLAQYNNIGGVVMYTDATLGTAPVATKVPLNPLWSGVVAATRTVGSPKQIDPNLFWYQYDASDPRNANLLDPLSSENATQLSQIRNRTVQLEPAAFNMRNGTVTLTVYVAQFSKFATDITDPHFQFYAGLPDYAGLQSQVTIPFRNVKVGFVAAPPQATATAILSPAAGGNVPAAPGTFSISAAVTSGGLPVTEGQVRFVSDVWGDLGTVPVSNGMAVLNAASLPGAGASTITAIYSDPAGQFASSTSAGLPLVAQTVTALAAQAPRVAFDRGMIPLTATVSDAAAAGTVTFYDGATVLGAASLAGGKALLPVELAAGDHSVRAVYSGDATHTASDSSAVAVEVSHVTVNATGLTVTDAQGRLDYRVKPFSGAAANRGLSLAEGDADGNGVTDLIVGPMPGSTGPVRIYDGATGALLRSFFAYQRFFRGGVAVAEFLSGQHADIVTVQQWGASPVIKVFDGRSGALLRSIPVSEFRKGAPFSLTVVDVGASGGPEVRIGGRSRGHAIFEVFDPRTGAKLNVPGASAASVRRTSVAHPKGHSRVGRRSR